MSGLPDIGDKAVVYVQARFARLAARRGRNVAAGNFYDAHGGQDSRYDPDSDHDLGYSAEFVEATANEQRAYEQALKAEKSARQSLYAAVKKHAKATGGQP